MEEYGEWSGQAINVGKSSIMFSQSTSASAKRSIKEILGLKDMGEEAIYLGSRLVFKRNKIKYFSQLKGKL